MAAGAKSGDVRSVQWPPGGEQPAFGNLWNGRAEGRQWTRMRYPDHVRIIVNPAAAGGRVGREWPGVEAKVRELGLAAPVVTTEAPGHATELAEAAVRGGVRQVVVAGGDGTLCEAAEGLYRAGGGALAFLPLGTGNDCARTLGIPLELEHAARAAAAAVTRPFDLIKVGDRVVLNAIGIGLTGEINRRAVRIKVVRGIAAYLVTAIVCLFRYPAPRVVLRTPEERWSGRMSLLAVHNGPTTGGGFRLTPQAQPTDGLLDACLVPEVGPFGRLTRLVAAMRGTLASKRGTLELQATGLDLEYEEPLPAHFDGNQTSLAPPSVRFEILKHALQVVVPEER